MTSPPFADALSPLFGRFRTRYQQSPLPAFFAWWLGELRACLPQRWQEQLRVQQAQLWIHRDEDGLLLERVDSAHRLLLKRWDDSEATPSEAAVLEAAGDNSARLPRVLLLSPVAVLLRRISIPAAAVGNARALVGFEIDRQTPFRLDQVEFDCRVLATEKGAKLATVELAVLPRERLEGAIAANAAGLPLDVVDLQVDGHRAGFNLLPATRRRAQDSRPMLINLGLLATAALLLLLAMSQLVDNRTAAVAAIEADVERQRTEARRSNQLRQTLDEAAAAANFLAQHKAGRASMIGVLRDLTDILPDDTFLERITINGSQINLTVQSGSAAKLIELFQGSTRFRDPTLLGAIQPDARSGKDRATLTVFAVIDEDPQ